MGEKSDVYQSQTMAWWWWWRIPKVPIPPGTRQRLFMEGYPTLMITLPWNGMDKGNGGAFEFLSTASYEVEFDDCRGKAYLSGDIDREISLSVTTTLKAVLYQRRTEPSIATELNKDARRRRDLERDCIATKYFLTIPQHLAGPALDLPQRRQNQRPFPKWKYHTEGLSPTCIHRDASVPGLVPRSVEYKNGTWCHLTAVSLRMAEYRYTQYSSSYKLALQSSSLIS